MRIVWLIVTSTLITNPSISQIFNLSFSSQNSISIFKTLNVTDGILSAGLYESGLGPKHIAITKYDFNGDTLWSKAFIDSNLANSRIKDILALPNNEIAVFGQSGSSYFSYLQLDSIGNVLSYKVYFHSQNSTIDNAILSADNNLLLVGQIDSIGPWQPMVVFIKMDITGNIIWSNAIDFSGGVWYDLKEFDDGSFIIYSPSNQSMLARIDSLGNLLWAKRYGFDYVGIENGLITDSLKNSYAIASDTNAFVLFKVDSLGVFQWAHKYGPFKAFQRCYNFFNVDGNFYFMVADSEILTHDSATTTILKVDNTGNLLYSAKYNLDTSYTPVYFHMLPNGNLLGAVNKVDPNTALTSFLFTEFDTTLINSCWLDTSYVFDLLTSTISTNYSTSVSSFIFSDSIRSINSINVFYNISDPCISLSIIEPEFKVAISNNPFQENVNFKVTEYEIINIEIYTLNGQQAISWSGSAKNIMINTDFLSVGIYFAHIRTKDGSYIRKLIKI